jgi:hypothetical protein
MAFLGVAALVSACTSLLGIDGNYANERASSQGTGGHDDFVGPAANGGSRTIDVDSGAVRGSGGEVIVGSGGGSTGGAGSGGRLGIPSGGGTTAGPASGGKASGGAAGSATGGAAGSGTGGAAGSARGGAPADAGGPACPTGTFRGTYMGTHRPSSGGTALTVMIGGNVTLHSTAMGESSLSVTGTLADPIDDPTGGISGTVTGTIDCVTGSGSLTMSKASVTTIVPAFFGPIDGSMDVTVAGATSLSGGFLIHETINPTFALGSGTWSADRTGN